MIRYISIMLFIGLALGQTNPCEDERYLDIKKKSLYKMSDREYTYFIQKDKECAEYKSSQLNKSNDIKSTIVKKHGEPLQQENILFGLNKEQRKFYMKNKLNIELKTKTSGSAYGWSSAVAYSGETSTKWEAYRGFDKISEEKFFRLTGYPDEAKLAKVFHSKSNKIGWCGCITGILGVLSFYIGGNAAYEEAYEFESGSPEREKLLDAGDKFNMYGLFISLSGTMLSLYGIMRLDQNWTAYSTVHGIANEYNNKLLQKISNK